MDISRELLPKGQWCRILGMRPADFHDIIELSAFLVQYFSQGSELGQKTLVNFQYCSDMHYRWESVITGLGEIDMVIRMNLLRTQLST